MASSRAAEWSWMFGAFLLIHLALGGTQPVNKLHKGLAYDGQQYFMMAQQTPRQLPPMAAAPFVYRIGTPLVAAVVAKSLDWVIASGFDRVNLVAGFLTVVLLLAWLQRHVADAWPRMLVVVCFMVEPHSTVRFTYFYPVNVDPVGLLFITAGLLAIDWFRDAPGLPRACGLAALVAVGVAFREVVLLVGLMALGVVATRPARVWVAGWLPLAAGLATMVAIHAWVVEVPSGYTPGGEVARWLREKSFIQLALAWFLVYGPLLTLVGLQARAALRTLRERPEWAIGLGIGATAAMLGGSDTERLLVFVAPLVWLLIAQALARARVPVASPLMAGLVVAQLLSSRIFVPIGDRPVPPQVAGTEWNRLASSIAQLSSYDSLWTQFCGPWAIRFYLIWFGVMAAMIVAGLRLGGYGRLASAPE